MSTHAKKTLALAVVVFGVLAFSSTLAHALWYAPEDMTAINPPPAKIVHNKASPGDQPARLSIPALTIDASVQEVGINAKGNMGIPSNYQDVAWYKYGTTPGEFGSAVIDGHVDNGLGLDGVFKHLGDIKIGDDVFVETQKGERLHFVVIDIESYPYTATPDDVIFNKADAAYLNLITCEGKWVKSDKTYDERLVVYTALVTDQS